MPCIATNHCVTGHRQAWRNMGAVDKDEIRDWTKLLDGNAHRQHGSGQDIGPVDRGDINERDRACECIQDPAVKKFTLISGQGLGIRDSIGDVVSCPENGGCHHGTSDRAASGLVNSGYQHSCLRPVAGQPLNGLV